MKKAILRVAAAAISAALALGAVGCRDRQSLLEGSSTVNDDMSALPIEIEEPSQTPEGAPDNENDINIGVSDTAEISFANAPELWKFVDSVNLSEDEFQAYIRETAIAERGIESKADVRAALDANWDRDYPIVESRSFSYMSTRKDGKAVYLEYTLEDGVRCSFRIFNKSLLGMAGYEMEIPDGVDAFDVELENSLMSKLRAFKKASSEAAGEEYVFFGECEGDCIEIITGGLELKRAKNLISGLYFGDLQELWTASYEGFHAGVFHLEFLNNAEIAEFISAANGTDAEFDSYINAVNEGSIYGITCRSDARRVIGMLNASSFPTYNEGAYSRLFIAGRYYGDYSLQYEFGNNVLYFSNYIDEDEDGVCDTLDELIQCLALQPIQIAEHANISRLYARYPEGSSDNTNWLYAEVNGAVMEIDASNRPEQECVERLLKFDFASFAELDEQSVPSTPAEALWYYHIDLPNNEALRHFVSSASLSDSEFASYLRANKTCFEREGSLTVRSKADVEAVISLFDVIPFPFHTEDGYNSVYIYVRDEAYFEVIYEFPGYTIWTFSPYIGDDSKVYANKTLDEVIAERAVQSVEIPDNEYISRLYVERSNEDIRRIFYAEINGQLVMIDAHNQTEQEAVQRLLEFDYGPLSLFGRE